MGPDSLNHLESIRPRKGDKFNCEPKERYVKHRLPSIRWSNYIENVIHTYQLNLDSFHLFIPIVYFDYFLLTQFDDVLFYKWIRRQKQHFFWGLAAPASCSSPFQSGASPRQLHELLIHEEEAFHFVIWCLLSFLDSFISLTMDFFQGNILIIALAHARRTELWRRGSTFPSTFRRWKELYLAAASQVLDFENPWRELT